MKLVIETQYMENYGAHDWDGEGFGPCPQYWKMKGGYSYVAESIEHSIKDGDFFAKKCEMIVDEIRAKIEHDTFYSREYILGWSVQPDDWMSEFERSQLEYEGSITFKEPRIDLEGNRL